MFHHCAAIMSHTDTLKKRSTVNRLPLIFLRCGSRNPAPPAIVVDTEGGELIDQVAFVIVEAQLTSRCDRLCEDVVITMDVVITIVQVAMQHEK